MNKYLSIFTIFTLLGFSGFGFADGHLSQSEVTKLFSGNSAEWEHEKKGYTASGYYDPSGTLKGMMNGSDPFLYKWSVNSDAELCIHKGSKVNCRIIKKSGDEYKKYKVKGNGKHVHIVTYRNFVKGNPNGY